MEGSGRIKAEPMTKTLTLQFMNGLGHSLTLVEYVLYIHLQAGQILVQFQTGGSRSQLLKAAASRSKEPVCGVE